MGTMLVNTAAVAGGGTTWATWDEVTESGWGDSDNTYIALMEGIAGANETGQGGGLVGADLVITDPNNNIAGATGTPPHRTVAAGQWMENTAAQRALIADPTFTLIFKFSINNPTPEAYLIDAYQLANDSFALKIIDAGADYRLTIINCTNIGLTTNDQVALPLSTGTIYWAAVACDNIANTWMGIATAKPSTKGDFLATFDGAAKSTMSDLSGSRNYMYGNGGAGDLDGEVYYVVFSDNYLF